MSSELYHNTKKTSFPDRETFNNTILLLTMVKSQYYYIVGFSRPKNMIEIAFDFESDLHRAITESITLHFAESDEYLVLRCEFKNLSERMGLEKGVIFKGKGEVTNCGGKVKYEYPVAKDKHIPVSVEKMNALILDAKMEIINFLEKQYSDYLSKKGKATL